MISPIFSPLIPLRTCLVAAVVFGGFSLGAFAQGSSPVTVKLEANVVKMVEGKERLFPEAKASPGDMVEYSAICKNTGSQRVTNLQPLIPIPAGTELDLKSIKPDALSATADGVVFSPIPLRKEVKQADGTVKQELVPAREYRAVRWSVAQLDPGGSAVVSLRVRVVGSAAAAASPTPQ